MTYTEKGRPHRGRPPVMREEIKMGWDPQQYLKFAQQRERPCRDLLARLTGPFERILDLGCGPGNSTGLLAQFFPKGYPLSSGKDTLGILIAPRTSEIYSSFMFEAILSAAPNTPFASDEM